MALITFNKSQYNDQAKKQAEIFKKLQEQNSFRFQYPTTDNADLLKTLIACQWNRISFPITKIDTNVSHDIVQHKYPNRDSARLESMGRNPLIIKVTAVFANTINPGKNEPWQKGTLYPNVYRQMLQESLQTTTGIFMHPFLGPINSKIQSFEPSMNAKFRGGEMVDITFIETIVEDDIEYRFTILDRAAVAATAIDTAFANLNPDPNLLGIPEYKTSLTEALKSVTAAINKTSRTIEGVYSTAPFDEVYGRCKEIVDATKRLNNSSNAFVKQTATILRSAMVILKNQTQVNANNIKNLITAQPNTLSSYSVNTGNTADELIKLNPNLLRKAIVPANSVIRYYQK